MVGNGRGRITSAGESNRFTYQSNKQAGKYLLGIDIPFKGQETLILESGEEKIADGTLYTKLSEELVKNKRFNSLKLLNLYLSKFSKFIESINASRIGNCEAERCFSGKMTSVDDTAHYTEKISNTFNFEVSMSGSIGGYYKRMTVLALHNKKKKDVFKLDLLFDQCSE